MQILSCIVVFMDHAHNIKFFPKIILNFVQFSLLAAIWYCVHLFPDKSIKFIKYLSS